MKKICMETAYHQDVHKAIGHNSHLTGLSPSQRWPTFVSKLG